MTVERLFETPLIFAELPDAAALNPQLRAAIVARRAQDGAGMTVSNRFGWHSDTRMVEWGGAAAMWLIEQVIGIADAHSLDIGASDRPRYAWFPEMWANVSGKGASHQIHCHPGAFWSAVYYVDDGYAGSGAKTLGGELEIEDPRAPMLQMAAPDLRFRERPGAPAEMPEALVRPGAGRLILFPGWLRHGVKPYLGEGTRISIAINLTAVKV